MSNNLPYFQFMVGDWMSGEIQICDMETQGIFINLCALIWKNGGEIADDPERIAKRLRIDKQCLSNAIAMLKQERIVLSSDAKMLSVKFITEQLDELTEKHEKRVNAGRKGGQVKQLNRRSNAKAMLKQCPSISDTDTEPESEPDNTPVVPKKSKRPKKRDSLARVEENTPTMIRIGSWFGRRANTLWSIDEAEILAVLGDVEMDLDVLERYYTDPGKEDRFLRTKVETLLNNWYGEMDKANQFALTQPAAKVDRNRQMVQEMMSDKHHTAEGAR